MLTFSDWNLITLLLMQSLLGNIGQNVRMIIPDYEDDHWIVSAFLGSDTEIDRENIADAVSELAIGIANSQSELSTSAITRIESNIVVSSADLGFEPTQTSRVIFRRYEEVSD